MAPALRAFALALRAASTCPSSPTCPQDDQCSLTSNGVTLQVSCATDYYGGDLQLTQTSTLAGCIRACSTITGCNAASYVNGNCYLKSTLNAAQPNANVVGVAVISRDTSTTPTPMPDTPKVCPASFTCPENDGCSYTDGSCTLTLSCGVDFYGGDLTNQYAASLEACTQACANNVQCAAASFVGGKGDGRCYLKNTKNGGSANDGVDAVYVVSNTVQSSSSATSPTPSPSSTVALTSAFSSTSTDVIISSTSISSGISTSTSSSISTSTSSSISTPTPTPTSTPTTSPTPAPQPTCGVNGVIRSGVLYTNVASQVQVSCRSRCLNYNLAGRSCRVYGFNPASGLCTLSLGFTAPTFEQAFNPKADSVTLWYDVGCPV